MKMPKESSVIDQLVWKKSAEGHGVLSWAAGYGGSSFPRQEKE